MDANVTLLQIVLRVLGRVDVLFFYNRKKEHNNNITNYKKG